MTSKGFIIMPKVNIPTKKQRIINKFKEIDSRILCETLDKNCYRLDYSLANLYIEASEKRLEEQCDSFIETFQKSIMKRIGESFCLPFDVRIIFKINKDMNLEDERIKMGILFGRIARRLALKKVGGFLIKKNENLEKIFEEEENESG
jgi:hypothetical protein